MYSMKLNNLFAGNHVIFINNKFNVNQDSNIANSFDPNKKSKPFLTDEQVDQELKEMGYNDTLEEFGYDIMMLLKIAIASITIFFIWSVLAIALIFCGIELGLSSKEVVNNNFYAGPNWSFIVILLGAMVAALWFIVNVIIGAYGLYRTKIFSTVDKSFIKVAKYYLIAIFIPLIQIYTGFMIFRRVSKYRKYFRRPSH